MTNSQEPLTLSDSYPMRSVSVDSIGPLPEDEYGNKYILVIICNFSKYTMLYVLYAAPDVAAKDFVHALLQCIAIFGVMEQVRSDGSTQFTAEICRDLSKYFEYEHLIIVPYHPQANGSGKKKW